MSRGAGEQHPQLVRETGRHLDGAGRLRREDELQPAHPRLGTVRERAQLRPARKRPETDADEGRQGRASCSAVPAAVYLCMGDDRSSSTGSAVRPALPYASERRREEAEGNAASPAYGPALTLRAQSIWQRIVQFARSTDGYTSLAWQTRRVARVPE